MKKDTTQPLSKVIRIDESEIRAIWMRCARSGVISVVRTGSICEPR